MTMQAITPLSAGFVTADGAMTGKNSADGSASFADLLASTEAGAPSPEEIQAAAAEHMMQRIAQVGFVQFAAEQQQENKMMRVLGILEAESPPDEQAVLQGIQDDFARNPPNGLQDMFSRIDKIVQAVPSNIGNDELGERMQAVVKQIRQMMEQPDNVLAKRAQDDGLNLASIGGS